MVDYNGVLYAGTFNAATFWKKSALGPLLQPRMGFNLWASTDGLTFTPVTQNGFGDRFSFGARSLTATPYGLFVGSANWWKGLRIWQGSLSPNALQLAPSNVALDTPQHRGAVALAWDAPRLATLFHIYRAALNGRELPRPSALNPEAPRAYLALPHAISLPSAYTAIGTTSRPYFVDQSARTHQPYIYYVVAQDAHGNLSAPSSAVTTGITPEPTFRSIGALVIYWMLSRKIAVAREIAILHALQAAYGRLHSGNVQGSRAMIEALRRQTLESAATTRFGRLYAENLSAVLSRLEKRIELVDAHIISAAHV